MPIPYHCHELLFLMSVLNDSMLDATRAVPPVLSSQGFLLLLSRAWNLCRLNWSVGFRFMVVPIFFQLLLTIGGSLLNHSMKTAFTPGHTGGLMMALAGIFFGLLLFGGWFLYGLVWGFCVFGLSRYYDAVLIREQPLTMRDCFQYTQAKLWPLLGLLIVMLVASLVLAVVDVLILFFGGFVSTLVMAQFPGWVAPFFAKGPATVMAVLFLILWGCLILGGVIALVTLQSFLFVFPTLAVATANDPAADFFKTLRYGVKRVFANFMRIPPFAMVLSILTGVMIFTALTPIFGVVVWEVQHPLPGHAPEFPLQGVIILNVARSLVELVSGPFMISALVLFWYDCRVRRDGLDLSLRLARLRQAALR
jgi:hypothetical protein